MQPETSTQERDVLIDDAYNPEERFEMEMLTDVTDEITFYPEDELCFSRDDHDDCNGYFRFFTDVDGNFYYFLYRQESWEMEWENAGHEINIVGANESHPHVARIVRDYMMENDTEENKLYIEGQRGKDFFADHSPENEEVLTGKAFRLYQSQEQIRKAQAAMKAKQEEEEAAMFKSFAESTENMMLLDIEDF